MQRQHQQLHTHEKILRYELAQKRKLLTELKQELEYCREKWEQAREKNTSTEEQWKKLRTEFASRKAATADDLNNSAESGYSDERECSSDDESISYGSKKKEAPEASPINDRSSDTEDNDETSHGSDADDILESAFSKACSTASLQQPNLTLPNVFLLETPTQEQPQPSFTPDNCDRLECSTEPSEKTDDDYVQINDNTTQATNYNNNNNYVPIDRLTDRNDTDAFETQSSTSQKFDDTSQKPDVTNTGQSDDTTDISSQNKDTASQLISQSNNSSSSFVNPFVGSSSSNENTDSSHVSSPSTSQSSEPVQRTSEEMLSKREERLRRLEEQCKQLVKKVTNTTNRRAEICTRLETLHEQYGSTDNAERNVESEESTVDVENKEEPERDEDIRVENKEEPERDEDTHEENNT